MPKLSAKWVPKYQIEKQNVNGASSLSKIWNFSRRSNWFPVASGDHKWNLVIPQWPRDNATTNGMVAKRLTPNQNFPSAIVRQKSCRLDFLLSRRHLPRWLSSKESDYEYGVLPIYADGIEGHFDVKIWPCTRTTMHSVTGHLQPRRNWPTLASIVLITLPILRIWPRPTTSCSLDWKKIQTSIFRPTWSSLLPRRPG
jgi:hypothetical protein